MECRETIEFFHDAAQEQEINDCIVHLEPGHYIIPNNTFLLENNSGRGERYLTSPLTETLEVSNENTQSMIYYLREELDKRRLSEEGAPVASNRTNLNYVLQDMNDEEIERLSNYLFAILKDGKLHLQTINIADSKLNSNLIKDDNSVNKESNNVDTFSSNLAVDCLDNITGKNLITGQIVTLHQYLNKMQQKTSNSKVLKTIINKRVAIGKTVEGKKLFGKILHVKQSVEKELIKNKESVILEDKPMQRQVIIKQHFVTRENFNHVIGKTLNGLMNLDTIQRKMRNKNLIVKLIEKAYDNEKNCTNKTVSYAYGYMECTFKDMEEQDDMWNFVLYNDKSCDDLLSRYDETCFLTIQMTLDRFGKNSTRVNLNEQKTNIQCYICKKTFKTPLHTRKHLKNVHFLNKQLLSNNAKQQKPNERLYRCIKCSKSFSTAGSLKRHLTVHDPSLRPLECSVCMQRFTDESSLRKHLLIHTGIRSFACDICSRTFVNRGDLNFHKQIHNPLKQFACSLCNRDFSRYSNLMRHTEIHRGVGALHKCDVCGCSYSFVSSLTRHIVQKHIGQQKQ